MILINEKKKTTHKNADSEMGKITENLMKLLLRLLKIYHNQYNNKKRWLRYGVPCKQRWETDKEMNVQAPSIRWEGPVSLLFPLCVIILAFCVCFIVVLQRRVRTKTAKSRESSSYYGTKINLMAYFKGRALFPILAQVIYWKRLPSTYFVN